jgi:hypothetical protein
MGRNEDIMAEINAKISKVVQMNLSLDMEIDGLWTKLMNMTSVAKSLSHTMTDQHKPQEEINGGPSYRWIITTCRMTPVLSTLIELLWKDQ